MLTDIKELSRTSTYQALYKGKIVEFEYVQTVYEPQSDLEILTYNGKTDIPRSIENELRELIERIDLGDAKLL